MAFNLKTVNELMETINSAETEKDMKDVEAHLIDLADSGKLTDEEYRRLDSLYYNRYLREFNN